jgi:phosphoesterase RecJ-like protein
MIDRYRNITILSHINPDADAIGTSLGIYSILKKYGKQVEVVNFSKDIPKYLDFLPNYSKIKRVIDYSDSLIIACDCGSIDRFGFELEGREIINIDHHHTNSYYGVLNYVDEKLSSASHKAYIEFSKEFKIDKDSAVCFYTALLSDTQHFTTSNINLDTFDFAMDLMKYGADHQEISRHLIYYRSLASIRIMAKALESLELHHNAQISSIKIDKKMIDEAGAKIADMASIADLGRTIATVDVAITLIILENKTKVSLRSKSIDISSIAESFGGGGHANACGFSVDIINLEEVLDKILKKLNQIMDNLV